MDTSAVQHGAVAVLAGGCCAIVLGVAMLVVGPRLGSQASGVLAACVLAALLGAAVYAWRLFFDPRLALAMVTVAAVWILGWSLRSDRLAHVVMAGLRKHSLQVAFLVLGGFTAAVSALPFLRLPNEQPASSDAGRGRPVDLLPTAEARTDRGTRLVLYEPTSRTRRQPPTEDASPHLLGQAAAFHVLRTADPDPTTNCHGWIFTNGAYWVQGDQVPLILRENGYHPVGDPNPGDLIVYHDEDSEITHIGLVRAALPDGLILIESKWGGLGRYIHAPGGQKYSTRWTYYRSPRRGHQLHGDYRNGSYPSPEPAPVHTPPA